MLLCCTRSRRKLALNGGSLRRRKLRFGRIGGDVPLASFEATIELGYAAIGDAARPNDEFPSSATLGRLSHECRAASRCEARRLASDSPLPYGATMQSRCAISLCELAPGIS